MTGGAVVRILTLVGVALVVAPIVVVLGASLNSGATAVFPPRGISLDGYIDLITAPSLRPPVVSSAYVGLVSAAVGLIVGVPAGLALSRYRVRGSHILNGILSLGFATPVVVSAVGYLVLFTRLHVAGDIWSAAFAIAVVNLPFMLWAVTAAVGTRGVELEDAASTLGADEVKQFFLVTLPSIAPGIVLGMFMMFIFGITEFTMSVILVDARNTTLPIYMFSSLRGSLSTSLAAIGALYLVVCVVIFFLAVRFGKLQQYLFRLQK